ncbi:MAG: Crp/Fnr family transcriptional regulator [Geminicoccaceae bacterium]
MVGSHAISGALTADELKRLNAIARSQYLPPRASIMTVGEPIDAVANIVAGVVKLTKSMADGREQIVGLMFPGDFLGRPFDKLASHNAEAATDVELCRFPRPAFETLLKEFPKLELRLFQRTLGELDMAREWMLLLGRKRADEKIATFLCHLGRRSGHGAADQGKVTLILPLTRAEMADFLGLTIETVSRQLTKLRTAGLIRTDSQRVVTIPDLRALAQLAGE